MFFAYSPLPSQRFTTSAQNVYVSDGVGIIKNVLTLADLRDLVAMGCASLQPSLGDLLFTLTGANFNTTTDQLLIPNFNGKFRIKRYVVTNASISLTTVAGGIYPAASKGGTPQVAAAQVYSSLTAASKALELTLNDPSTVLAAGTPLYFSPTTPQGAPATGDVYAFGDLYV